MGKKSKKKPGEGKKIVPTDDKSLVLEDLNPNQVLFCELYSGSGEHFGNGTMAYSIAFDIEIPELPDKKGKGYKKLKKERDKAMNTCASSATRLLRNVKILQKCDAVLQDRLKDEIVDAELSYAITQRKDLPSKIRAISEYNKVRKRVGSGLMMPIQININEDREKYA